MIRRPIMPGAGNQINEDNSYLQPPLDMDGHVIKIGSFIEIHPRFDLWMRGARCGIVQRFNKDRTIQVKMNNIRIKRIRRFFPEDLKVV